MTSVLVLLHLLRYKVKRRMEHHLTTNNHFACTEYLIETYKLFPMVKILFKVEEIRSLICLFYLLINNSCKWHCYKLLTKESFNSLNVMSRDCSHWVNDIKYRGARIFSTSFACLISNGI